jgi:hypothetical protein
MNFKAKYLKFDPSAAINANIKFMALFLAEFHYSSIWLKINIAQQLSADGSLSIFNSICWKGLLNVEII